MRLVPFLFCIALSTFSCFSFVAGQTTEPEASASTLEVLDVIVATRINKSKVTGTANAVIVGPDGAGVEGVEVTIQWGEPLAGTSTAVTDVDGVATFSQTFRVRGFDGEISATVIEIVGEVPAEAVPEEPTVEPTVEPAPETPATSVGGIYVVGDQIVSEAAGPLFLKGVNFEASWKYTQGEKLEEVAKTGANSVRIVWNIWQDTDKLSLVMNRAINNGLLPILEIHLSLIHI